MTKTGNVVPTITKAEHIGPEDTGDNIEAKRVAGYIWDPTLGVAGEWKRDEGITAVIENLNVNTEPTFSENPTDPTPIPSFGLVDADKHVQTDVLSSALPTGASTSALQNTGNTKLDTIITNTGNALTDTQLRAAPVPVSMSQDIEIGAVELKNGADDTRATVTAANALKVDGSAVTQPVSATTLPLPTGAATATKQDDQTALLTTIDTDTGSIDTKLTTTNTNTGSSATSLAIIDDWDESDRAKVNPIVGQAGIAANAGAASATTTRTVTATDSPEVATLALIDANLGAKADTVASSDTGTFSLIALTKRIAQWLTYIAGYGQNTVVELQTLNSLIPERYDHMGLSYTGDRLDQVDFELLGSPTTNIVLTYTGDNLTSVDVT